MSAFEFHETMAGSYHLTSAPADDRPMSFSIRARSPSFLRFLRKPDLEIDGEIDAEGLADHRQLRGRLGLYLLRDKTLVYSFAFKGNDSEAYRFHGTKHVTLGTLPESMTVLPGVIRRERDDAEIAEALVRFDLRGDLLDFLRSFRLVF